MNTPDARVLLVEDDLAVANLYKMRLEAENITVKHCNEGEKALQTVAEFQPQLVLLDLMMPKLDGFTMIDILRNTPKTQNIKIVVFSALSQPEDQKRALELGADDYLVKSQVVIADVIAAIRRHLKLPPKPAAPPEA